MQFQNAFLQPMESQWVTPRLVHIHFVHILPTVYDSYATASHLYIILTLNNLRPPETFWRKHFDWVYSHTLAMLYVVVCLFLEFCYPILLAWHGVWLIAPCVMLASHSLLNDWWQLADRSSSGSRQKSRMPHKVLPPPLISQHTRLSSKGQHSLSTVRSETRACSLGNVACTCNNLKCSMQIHLQCRTTLLPIEWPWTNQPFDWSTWLAKLCNEVLLAFGDLYVNVWHKSAVKYSMMIRTDLTVDSILNILKLKWQLM